MPRLRKLLPGSSFAIILTDSNLEFFYNTESKESTWDVPDELLGLLNELVESGKKRIAEERAEEEERKRRIEEDEEESRKRRKIEIDELEPEPEIEIERTREPSAPSSEPSDDEIAARIRALRGDLPPTNNSGLDKPTDSKSTDEKKEKKPKKPTLTPEQLSALVAAFTSLLTDLRISPYAMYESSLSLFDTHPAFLALPEGERRKAFDEYCTAASAPKPKEAKESETEKWKKWASEHTSHRSTWTEFVRKHGRDREFLALKDPAARQRMFENLVAEKKARHDADVEKTKPGFLALLSETKIRAGEEWKEVKRRIDRDPRYRAVRSSTDKEEWFKEHVEGLNRAKSSADKAEREGAALRARQERAEDERRALERSQRRAVGGFRAAEAERELAAILVDYVRSHDARLHEMLPRLRKDPRWSSVQGMEEQAIAMVYSDHVKRLWERRVRAFEELLDGLVGKGTRWEDIWDTIRDKDAVLRLEKDEEGVRQLFEDYLKRRGSKAERELEEALKGSNFLKFHVRNAVRTVEAEMHEELERKGSKGELVKDAEIDQSKVWEHVDLAEVEAVLAREQAYRDVEKSVRERMVLSFIRGLVGEVVAERGGKRDLLVARMAGGKVDA